MWIYPRPLPRRRSNQIIYKYIYIINFMNLKNNINIYIFQYFFYLFFMLNKQISFPPVTGFSQKLFYQKKNSQKILSQRTGVNPLPLPISWLNIFDVFLQLFPTPAYVLVRVYTILFPSKVVQCDAIRWEQFTRRRRFGQL